VDIIDQILGWNEEERKKREEAARAYAAEDAAVASSGRVPFFGLPMPERTGRPDDYAGPPPDLYDMIENPENYNPETGKPLDLTREQGREGRLEKTPEQAMNTPAVSADKDIVEDALRAVAAGKKQNVFDFDKIIKDHNGVDTGGGIITTKEVKNPESKGLIDRGYVKDDTGRTQFIYGKKEDGTGPVNYPFITDRDGSKANKDGMTGKTGNPIQDFYNSAAREVSKLHGITDIRTFNPYEETRKEVNKVKDAFFRHIFGNKVASVSQLTPEQSKYWQAQLKSLETEKFNEIKTKYTLARQELDNVMKLYEKSKDKWKIIPENAGGIYNSETAETRRMGPGKNLTDATAKHVEDKVASIFKPIIEEPGMEVKSEDVYNRLDGQHRAIFDEIRDRAFKELRDNPGRTTYAEAISKITKEMGISLEKDKDGKVIMKMGGKQGKTETPPVQGARKGPDGLWYVEKDGKYYRVKQKGL
jgi:hypothetical protein